MSMLAIQVAIGALNDRADAPRDALAKPAKPIPSGLVSRQAALAVAIVAGVAGVALSAFSGLPTAIVAGVGLALGLAYDLRLSTTRWSWLPLALALPLLPVHAWVGSTGSIPGGLLPLLPVGVLAGAALAIANGLVDVERDASTRRPAAVVTLGARRAFWVHLVLLAGVAAIAVVVAPGVGEVSSDGAAASPLPLETLRWLRAWGVFLGIGVLGVGAAAVGLGRPAIRERGWELEAIGIAAIGLGWLAGVAASSGSAGA